MNHYSRSSFYQLLSFVCLLPFKSRLETRGRSCRHAGTRYNARGLDDDAEVGCYRDEPQIINKSAPFGKLTMEIILEMVIYDDLWLSYGWNPIVTNNQKAHLLVI